MIKVEQTELRFADDMCLVTRSERNHMNAVEIQIYEE